MKIETTNLDGIVVVHPDVFGDERGYFLENWSERAYEQAGIGSRFVQDNISFSTKGILRGLHLQNPNSQGKLVHVLDGEVFDVAVDVRVDSPTFGQWFGITLSAANHTQMYVPPGFAHGFCVVSDTALFAYKCTDIYNREAELGVLWDDPDIAIDWPVTAPELSAKDEQLPRLAQIEPSRLPRFDPGGS